MRWSLALLSVCSAAVMAALLWLGFWQLDRLEWKEGMIARVQANIEGTPKSVTEIQTLIASGEDIEYRPAKVTGTFDHSKEQHFFAPYKGQSGYFIYTPLKRSEGDVIFVNRGFVPYALKDSDARREGQTSGEVTVVGLARTAPKDKPNALVHDNDLEKNVYHWKSIEDMASRAYAGADIKLINFFLDANDAPNPGGYPVGGVTRVRFSNNHLEYAITWFGLAAALFFVGGYFLWSRLRRPRVAALDS